MTMMETPKTTEATSSLMSEDALNAVYPIIEEVDSNFADLVMLSTDQRQAIEAALFTDGLAVLLRAGSGSGKTYMTKVLAKLVNLSYKRFQGTPDLEVSDLTGHNSYDRRTGGTLYVPGILMSQFVHGDDISRMPERVQSGLLEGIEEGQVSVGTETHILPTPRFLVASENPRTVDRGTSRIVGALADRFAISLRFARYDAAHKVEANNMAEKMKKAGGQVPQVIKDASKLILVRATTDDVRVEEALKIQTANVVEAIYEHPSIDSEASELDFARMVRDDISFSRGLAIVRKKRNVTDEHLSGLFFTMPHRLSINEEGRDRLEDQDNVPKKDRLTEHDVIMNIIAESIHKVAPRSTVNRPAEVAELAGSASSKPETTPEPNPDQKSAS